jgi:hypothetical protein
MTPTPNWFAYFALLSWPLVAAYLFYKRPFSQAIIWTILGAFLLLPVRTVIKFEMIPGLDKYTIPNIAALVGCILVTRRLPRLFLGFGLAEVLMLMLLIGPFITSELNGDPIRIGPIVLPGVGTYDAGSAVAAEFLFFVPFILGREFLRRAEDMEQILRALVIAGIAYSLPILFEVRMSPQLHTWLYGYTPTHFVQLMREGGFRPAVFIGHGLSVAFFVTTTVVASAALWRTGTRTMRMPSGGVTVWLSVVLVLCKTLSSLAYAIVLAPLVRWATPRLQMRVATILVIIALSYPMLRVLDLVPTTLMYDVAASVDVDRAKSLQFRFDQEAALLEHASERIWFGWGRFGRNRVYSESGRDISITDGEWIIRLGIFGFVGFIAEFGLLAYSVIRSAAAIRLSESTREVAIMSALAIIVAINLIDLLPNSSISPWTWFLAGALLGRGEEMRMAKSRVFNGFENTR